MALKIGLTGGIASGKSAAAAAFARLDVPVIDADVIAREVVAPGQEALAAVVETLGDDILTARGQLDRKRLRQRMFEDDAIRIEVESILHPIITNTLKSRLDTCRAPYCVAVVPLLVETGFDTQVNRVLVIDCSEEAQRRRLMRRDGESAAGARRILAHQASRARRLARADDVVENENDLAALQVKIADLHRKYLRLAGASAPDLLTHGRS